MDDATSFTADPSNAQMVQAWDGKEGAFWTARSDRFDDGLANHHGPFLAAAAIGEGDRVLDVGCGTGLATRDAARIAHAGSALGVDLSSQMIALARKIAADEGLDNVEFLQADAQIYPFESESFDGIISRTGAMFFGDRATAFTNLQRALRPDGRLTLLTWQGLAEQEWLLEIRSAMAVGRDIPAPPPDAPSPFALSDPERVTSILEGAGFVDITFEDVHAPMRYGPADEAFTFAREFTSWMIEDLDEAGQHAALTALRATIDEHVSEDGVTFRSATWIVQARKK